MQERKEQTWRILHVDDDEDDYILTRSMLNQAHGSTIAVEWASSFEMGQKMLEADHYDAALIDYDLGTGTGVELIREFVDRGYTAPLILYTGRGSYDVDVEAMRAGATIYLPKGEVNPLSLERSIRYAIERKQTEEAHRISEHKLRIALEAAQLGAWVYNFEDDTLELDEQAQRLYRTTAPVIIHEDLVQTFLHPDDIRPMRAHLAEISQPGSRGHYQIEYRILQPDGSYCWLNAWGLVQFEGEGENRRAVSLTGASRDITDAKRSEQELQASEKRLRIAMGAARSGAWEIDFLTGEHTWTPELYHILGFDPNQTPITIENYNEMIHPADRQQAVSIFESTLANHQPAFSNQFRFIRPDRKIIWLSAIGNFEYEENGRPLKGYGINQDITEQVRIKETLQESEARYRKLFNNHHTPMMLIDPKNGQIMNANQAACTFYGWDWETLTQMPISAINVLPPDQVQKEMSAAQQASGSQLFKFRHRLASGEIRDVEVYSGPIDWDSKEFLFSIIIDVTERKKIERALQESESRFRRIADTMPSFIWTADPRGRVDYVNHQYEEYTGKIAYRDGGWFSVPIHPDDRRESLTKWAEALKTGQSYQMEHRIQRSDGEYRWFLTRAVPVRNGDWIIKWYGSATDIHEVKQYQENLQQNNEKLFRLSEELKRSNQALVDFASIASHDLQEPLRKILAFGDRLHATYSEQLGEHGQDYIQRILFAAKRMQKMIQGLLEYSRVTIKAQPFEAVDLNEVVAEVLSDLEILILKTKGRVEVSALPIVYGDPLQMRQLMQNLIGNALKYHRDGIAPVVKVYNQSADATERPIRLIVEDNGIGFDERFIDKIFQPMQRLHAQKHYEGTGIGLAVCAKIVDRHGGIITARSQPNQGSTFVIDLPAGACCNERSINRQRQG
jgi:PAS domain S-box-containing protein